MGGVAQIDALRAASEADKVSAAKDALTADQKSLEQNRRMRADEAQARIENLQRSIASLEGEIATRRATIARIQETIDQHAIRAPVSLTRYVTDGRLLPMRPALLVANSCTWLIPKPPMRGASSTD